MYLDFNCQNCGHHKYPVGTHNHKRQSRGREIENYCEREIYSRDLGFRQLIIRLFQTSRHTFYTHNTCEKLTLQRKGKTTTEMTLAWINSVTLDTTHEKKENTVSNICKFNTFNKRKPNQVCTTTFNFSAFSLIAMKGML